MVKMGKSFDPVEIEWLVATSFNHAIDYHGCNEEDACRQWAMKALKLAEFTGDDGNLLNTIRRRFAKLHFSGRGVSTVE